MIPNYFTDAELARLENHPEYIRFKNGRECPVCKNTGSFCYLGQTYDCPDDDYGHVTLRLVKYNWLHNIQLEFQQLVWDEFPHMEVADEVDIYVANFDNLRIRGAGITFYSPKLGTGKTWAATRILREVIKAGYDGWFANFLEVKSYYEMDDRKERDYLTNRLKGAETLVLDEIRAPWTNAMREFYANALEEFLRPRMGANFPTIITTNMTPDELEETYPRVYSLVMAKNLWVEMPGSDARTSGDVANKNYELGMNGESCPIL